MPDCPRADAHSRAARRILAERVGAGPGEQPNTVQRPRISVESCGGHFREESQTPDGEALRDDEHFSYVAAWDFQGVDKQPTLHKEPLEFEYVKPTQRSYK